MFDQQVDVLSVQDQQNLGMPALGREPSSDAPRMISHLRLIDFRRQEEANAPRGTPGGYGPRDAMVAP